MQDEGLGCEAEGHACRAGVIDRGERLFVLDDLVGNPTFVEPSPDRIDALGGALHGAMLGESVVERAGLRDSYRCRLP